MALIRSILLALIGLSVIGCSTVELSRADRLSIQTVYIKKDVWLEESIEYDGGTLEGYDPFPLLLYSMPITRELLILYALTPPGMWQVSQAYDAMSEAFTERMERRGIFVGEIARDRMLNRMKKLKVFPVVELQPAGFQQGHLDRGEAFLDLKVRAGIDAPRWTLTPGVRPWVEVEGTLTDHEGRVLWRQSGEVSIYDSSVPTYEGQKLFDQPSLFKDAIYISIPMAIKELIQKFKKT